MMINKELNVETRNASDVHSDSSKADSINSEYSEESIPNDSEKNYQRNAYEEHFSDILLNILDHKHFYSLHSSTEIRVLHLFLSTLSPSAKGLYARLFQRKGPWFRATSLLEYSEIDKQQIVLFKALEELAGEHFITPFAHQIRSSPQKQLEDCTEILTFCLSKMEILDVLTQLTGGKKFMTVSKSSTKHQMLACIQKLMKTQRRLDGSSLPLASTINEVIEKNAIDTLLAQQTAENTDFNGRKIYFFKLCEIPKAVFLRVFRLFYLTKSRQLPTIVPFCANEETGYALNDPTMQNSTWPGLMERFHKWTFQKYKASSDVEIFPSVPHFVCYEIAIELQHRLQQVIQDRLELIKEQNRATSGNKREVEDKVVGYCYLGLTPELFLFQNLKEMQSGLYATDMLKSVTYADVDEYFKRPSTFEGLLKEVVACFKAFHCFDEQSIRSKETKMSEEFLDQFSAGNVLAFSIWESVKVLEKLRQYPSAVELLQLLIKSPYWAVKRGRWYGRLVLNLGHLKEHQLALDACNEALNDPNVLLSYSWVHDLRKRQQTLSRRLNKSKSKSKPSLLPNSDPSMCRSADLNKILERISLEDLVLKEEVIDGRALNSRTGERCRFVGFDDSNCTVEELVLQHYGRDGWQGFHSEGRELFGLFGLLMWEVLFSDSVRGVFPCRYQTSPLDATYPHLFYSQRKELWQQRVNEIRSFSIRQLADSIETSWLQHEGKINSFVSWDSITLSSLKIIGCGIGCEPLSEIFQEMARNYRNLRAGVPDLVIFRIRARNGDNHLDSTSQQCIRYEIENDNENNDVVVEDCELEVRFVEVKSERDKVSDQQLVWLRLFQNAGIEACICHVTEDQQRKRKRIERKTLDKKKSSCVSLTGEDDVE